MSHIALYLLVDFIRTNPGAAAWLIGGLFTVIACLLGVSYRVVFQRLVAVEKRVDTVEATLERYEEHVGIGDTAMKVLAARIDKHMAEEETRVWTGVTDIKAQLAELQLENAEAHADIIHTHGERIAKVEERIESVRTGLPNGEIQLLLKLVKQLVAAKE